MIEDLLIIFVKNPELGRVKSRLARSIGEAQALAVYLKLLEHTRVITKNLACTKVVYYSDYIDAEDEWDNKIYHKSLQTGKDLGIRMSNAFKEQFKQGYSNICIIGSDNFEISEAIIKTAFNNLYHYDAVIGPSRDGGYYLLGLNCYMNSIFKNKVWGTSKVFENTMEDLEKENLKIDLLPALNDIDTVEDLNQSNWLKDS